MAHKQISPDERAKKALKDKPTYMPDEPTIIGNPEHLKKSDEEIEREENGGNKESGKKGSKGCK